MTSTNSQTIQQLEPNILKEWLEHEKVTLIDVRERGEYASEHIQGAQLLPLSQFNPSEIKQTPGKTVVLYCQSSNRSGKAAQKLLDSGWQSVIHLQGGLNQWKQSGYPVEVNKNAPISLMRQVQIVAGSMVFLGTVLGAFVSPGFLILSGFVGAGLVFAGVTGTCGLAMVLAKLPYNQKA